MVESFWMRGALVGRQGAVRGEVLVVQGAVWVVIKGDGEGLVGAGWWVVRWGSGSMEERVQSD